MDLSSKLVLNAQNTPVQAQIPIAQASPTNGVILVTVRWGKEVESKSAPRFILPTAYYIFQYCIE